MTEPMNPAQDETTNTLGVTMFALSSSSHLEAEGQTDKRCRVCGHTRPLTEMARASATRDGFQARCADCNRQGAARWHRENRDRAIAASRQRWDANPGMHVLGPDGADVYRSLSEMQNGQCGWPGCDRTGEENGARLSVDHDRGCCPERRSCKRCVRGLLCVGHNRVVGMHEAGRLKNPDTIARAERFLADSVIRQAALQKAQAVL